jgi:hypothetical protein
MITFTIRDKELAAEQNSRYIVLVTTNGMSYTAYETIEEFMQEWHDTISGMQINVLCFAGQKALTLTSDWTAQDLYPFTKELATVVAAGARPCEMLSNGSVKPGAILVDKANRQTTFWRLNPNSKEY